MEWSLNYLNSHIENRVEENLNLDYKAAASLEKNEKRTIEISKDISAFANSDGGIIIYGIKEDKENKHLPSEIDPIDRDAITKEWLEQIIQGKIRPRISGIKVIPIEVDNDPKKVVFVVEIPKSNTAHQADDKRYYKRFNFNSEPMYDFEIRDVLNRQKNPEIDLEFVIKKHSYEIQQSTIPSFSLGKDGGIISTTPPKKIKTDYTLRIYAKNNGNVLANYINAYLFIKSDLLIDYNKSNSGSIQIFANNTIRDVVDSTILSTMNGSRSIPKYGPSRYDPILPRQRMKIEHESISEDAIDSDNEIEWIVYADNSEPRTGKIIFKDIEVKIK